VRRRSDRWLPGRRWGVVPKRVWLLCTFYIT
jgi:hypothetical protein